MGNSVCCASAQVYPTQDILRHDGVYDFHDRYCLDRTASSYVLKESGNHKKEVLWVGGGRSPRGFFYYRSLWQMMLVHRCVLGSLSHTERQDAWTALLSRESTGTLSTILRRYDVSQSESRGLAGQRCVWCGAAKPKKQSGVQFAQLRYETRDKRRGKKVDLLVCTQCRKRFTFLAPRIRRSVLPARSTLAKESVYRRWLQEFVFMVFGCGEGKGSLGVDGALLCEEHARHAVSDGGKTTDDVDNVRVDIHNESGDSKDVRRKQWWFPRKTAVQTSVSLIYHGIPASMRAYLYSCALGTFAVARIESQLRISAVHAHCQPRQIHGSFAPSTRSPRTPSPVDSMRCTFMNLLRVASVPVYTYACDHAAEEDVSQDSNAAPEVVGLPQNAVLETPGLLQGFLSPTVLRQISVDMPRTFPEHPSFRQACTPVQMWGYLRSVLTNSANPDISAQAQVFVVLCAWCVRHPKVRYVQGMNVLAGMCVLMAPGRPRWAYYIFSSLMVAYDKVELDAVRDMQDTHLSTSSLAMLSDDRRVNAFGLLRIYKGDGLETLTRTMRNTEKMFRGLFPRVYNRWSDDFGETAMVEHSRLDSFCVDDGWTDAEPVPLMPPSNQDYAEPPQPEMDSESKIGEFSGPRSPSVQLQKSVEGFMQPMTPPSSVLAFQASWLMTFMVYAVSGSGKGTANAQLSPSVAPQSPAVKDHVSRMDGCLLCELTRAVRVPGSSESPCTSHESKRATDSDVFGKQRALEFSLGVEGEGGEPDRACAPPGVIQVEPQRPRGPLEHVFRMWDVVVMFSGFARWLCMPPEVPEAILGGDSVDWGEWADGYLARLEGSETKHSSVRGAHSQARGDDTVDATSSVVCRPLTPTQAQPWLRVIRPLPVIDHLIPSFTAQYLSLVGEHVHTAFELMGCGSGVHMPFQHVLWMLLEQYAHYWVV